MFIDPSDTDVELEELLLSLESRLDGPERLTAAEVEQLKWDVQDVRSELANRGNPAVAGKATPRGDDINK
jgi:hypothetical protein